MGYDAKTKRSIPTHVTRIDTHEGDFALSGVWVTPVNELTADNRNQLATPTLLEATANHPVLTASGRKSLGDVQVGEVLYHYDAAIQGVSAYKIVRIAKKVRSVNKVYNLVTESGAYLIGDMVVLDK
ncbi:hypothetical protein [Spirosoma sp. KNUC1025]|uniref:hypothetical protein n=1 Tax=Spirosoma sp. KNUC1025 TaxID=2894082 RepID=UPI003869BF34